MKKESKIIALNKDYPEVSLLVELSHEISNFKSGFKGIMNHTYILAPWASSLFGFEIDNNTAYIGVPSTIFDQLARTKLFLINYIEGKAGFFIVFDMGAEGKKRPVAIRVHMRTSRVKSLSKFKKATLIRMNKDGTAQPGYDEDEFQLYIKPVKGLDWEYFNNN